MHCLEWVRFLSSPIARVGRKAGNVLQVISQMHQGWTGDRRRFFHFGLVAGSSQLACREAGTAHNAKRILGSPVSRYGRRSQFEKARRHLRTTRTPESSSSRTPLADSRGILTPSSLHFERHHAGVPTIDPDEHRLLVHGMVDRPLVFTVADLKRLPSVSRVCFIECAGNGGSEWGPRTAPDVQQSHGLASCSEWTGVPLSVLLTEAGARAGSSWLLVEGADACKMQRSVPIQKAMDDAIVAYGQNGEALRPEQGYPVRLVLPGWEGNTSVKWLRRIKVWDRPHMTRDETSRYTELLRDGRSRQFSFVMEVKSVITFPSGRLKLPGPGHFEIRGLAWSGRGAIERVKVSTDAGRTWLDAEVQEPRLRKAFTRFRFPWRWEGGPAILQSRAIDDQGYRQPTVAELIAARGANSAYHNNAIKGWRVAADGWVSSASG